MIHKAKNLSREQRIAIEALIGRAIAEQEDISVRALPLSPELPPERRREIVDALEAHFAKVDSQRRSMPAVEVDDLINEALRTTRPNYRPAP
jgi:hypothetical protein